MALHFFDRDLSWLSFNERVLLEAAADDVPLAERLNFLSIYSSNLDEFYRVRVPSLMAVAALANHNDKKQSAHYNEILLQANAMVQNQLSVFGDILVNKILHECKERGVQIIYNQPIPDFAREPASDYFFNEVLGYLQPIDLVKGLDFFPENNKLYALLVLKQNGKEKLRIINIPSDHLSRFFIFKQQDEQYVIFLDDIIKENVYRIFTGYSVESVYNFKITRDAELDLQDEFEEDIVDKMEKQIAKRDFGLATRVLTDANMPVQLLQSLVTTLNLEHAHFMAGGNYHNLKDLATVPLHDPSFFYDKWKPLQLALDSKSRSLLETIARQDIIIHTPYHAYDMVIRFFNEAAIDDQVEELYVTLYRIAKESRIANALISAAKNGKKVTVMVELKARFDESNNIKWAKKMKAAGINIHYSTALLKVHAKIALVKKKENGKTSYLGLLATGNLNEITARFYTDHILLTSHEGMLQELQILFKQLGKKKPAIDRNHIHFHHLLIAQFNMRDRFMALIDREIDLAKQGYPGLITIKLNNLEERTLINKLYEASAHAVKIRLIVRSVCCLVPGVVGLSENISVNRIVDRYLEHGRVFIFHNNGQDEVYLGSADWMSRNIYKRIEVCFPIYDVGIKNEMIDIINIQLQDNVKSVVISDTLENISLPAQSPAIQSQKEIYRKLSGN